MENKRYIGNTCEQYVCNWLISRGYQVIARNYYVYGVGEIDIVITHPSKKIVYFLEVRSRGQPIYGSPAESLSWYKLSRIRKASFNFIYQYPSYREYIKKFIFASLVKTSYKQIIKFYEI